MLMWLMRYNVRTIYVPGSQHCVPDCLSRQPLRCVDAACLQMQQDVEEYVNGTFQSLPMTDRRLSEVKRAQQEDGEIQRAVEYTVSGWSPEAGSHPLYGVRDQLSVANGVLMYASRLVIPHQMRSQMLSKLHDDGHFGISKCRERAKSSVWWPDMNSDLKEYLACCQFCQVHAPVHRKEPLIPTPVPDKPWVACGIRYLSA